MEEIEKTIQQQIADGCTRDAVAESYRRALTAFMESDFSIVNHIIVKRWSRAGLKYIKTKAWRDLMIKHL